MLDNSSNGNPLLDKLIEVSTFGLDDLELNRQGRMSGLQRFRLMLMAISYLGIGTLSFILAIGGVRMLIKQPQSSLFLAVVIWVILFTTTGIYWLRHAIPMWQDARNSTVKSIDGPLFELYVPSSYGRARMYSLHYKISKKVFDIALFAPKVLQQEQHCRGYYTPRSEILVGIEPVERRSFNSSVFQSSR